MQTFSYWKRPWQRWLFLAAGILQLFCLVLYVQQYRQIARAGVLSAEQWEHYAAQKALQCAMHGISAGGFLGAFGIGSFARSQKAAMRAEAIFLLCLTLAWGVVALAIPLSVVRGGWVLWGFIWALMLGVSAYLLCKKPPTS